MWKLLYVFRALPPPIIRSTYNWIYSICYLSTVLLSAAIVEELERSSNSSTIAALQIITVLQIPDAVDTVVCAPDDGWKYHPKHVEQFPHKINCVTLHLVGYKLEYVEVNC
jgi:hypothetical protein